jgi:hypothetical protein
MQLRHESRLYSASYTCTVATLFTACENAARACCGHYWSIPNTLVRYIPTFVVMELAVSRLGGESRFVQFVMSMRSGIFKELTFLSYNLGYDTEYSGRWLRKVSEKQTAGCRWHVSPSKWYLQYKYTMSLGRYLCLAGKAETAQPKFVSTTLLITLIHKTFTMVPSLTLLHQCCSYVTSDTFWKPIRLETCTVLTSLQINRPSLN